MQEIAIVVSSMPDEENAKELSKLGFTNIMVDTESKLLAKQPQEGVKVVPYPWNITQEMVDAWKAEGTSRVILDKKPDSPAEQVDKQVLKDINETVTKLSDVKQQKFNKIEQKRMQAYAERRKRAINKGVAEEKVDQVLAEEDWRNTPVDQKVARMEQVLSNVYRGLTQDIIKLRQNDSAIGDAFEINNRMVYLMFQKLGISPEQQAEFASQAQAELQAEHTKKMEEKKAAEAAAQKKVTEEQEKAKLEQMTKEEKAPVPQGTEAPAESTVFGG